MNHTNVAIVAMLAATAAALIGAIEVNIAYKMQHHKQLT
jgi:hypothetical protein